MTVVASSYNNSGHDAGRGDGSGQVRRGDMSRTNNPHTPPSSRRPQQQQQQQNSWNNRNSESSDRRFDDRERNMKRPLHYDQQQKQQRQHQRYTSSQEEPPRQRWKHSNGHYQSSSQQQSSISSNNNPHTQQKTQSSSSSMPSVSRRQHNDSHDRRRMNEHDSTNRRDYHHRHFDLPSNNNSNNNRYRDRRSNRWHHSDRNIRDPRHQQPQKQFLPPRNHGERNRQSMSSQNDGRWDERRREYRPNHQQQHQQQQQQTQQGERQNSVLSREQYLHGRDNGTTTANGKLSSSTTEPKSHEKDGQPASVSASIALHKQSSSSSSISRNSGHTINHQTKPQHTNMTSRPQQPSQLQSTHSSSLSILKRFASPKASAVHTHKKNGAGVSTKKNDNKSNNPFLSSTATTATASMGQLSSSSNNTCSKRRTPLKKRWIPVQPSHPSPETRGRSFEKEKHESNNNNNTLGNNSDSANDIIKLSNPTDGAFKSNKQQGLSMEKNFAANKGNMEHRHKSLLNTVTSSTPAEIIAEDESIQPTLEESISDDLMHRQEEGKLINKRPKKISTTTTTSKQSTLKTMDATTATPDLTEPSTEEFSLQQQQQPRQQQQQPYGRPSEICIPKAAVETLMSKDNNCNHDGGMNDVAAVAALPEPSTVVVSESPHSLPAAVEDEEDETHEEGEREHVDTVVTSEMREHDDDVDTSSLRISHNKQENDRYQEGKNRTHNATNNKSTAGKVQSMVWTDTTRSAVMKKRGGEGNIATNNTQELVVNGEESNKTTSLVNAGPLQEDVVKEHSKLQQQEENPKLTSTGCNWDTGVIDYDSDSSDDSTSSEEDEQEILLWAQKMFGVTPPGLLKGRNDGCDVVKPQNQEEETIKSKDEMDSFEDTNTATNDISINSDWNFHGINNTTIQPTAAELVKSRNRKAARKLKKKRKKKRMLQEEDHMNATSLKTEGRDIGYKNHSHTVVSKKSRKKSEEQLRLESEEAKRVKKEAKALTSAEIKAILGDDEYISPTSEWVRRSSRQPCRSAINAPNVRSLTGKLRDNDADMVVLKLKKYISDPDTPQLVLDAVLDALEENTNCEALYIQNFNLGMRDKQVLQLLKILQQPSCRIWCLNIGETYNVKNRTWKAFTRGLKKTKVTHMYASEHTITSEMKDSIRNILRRNRQKHDMHINPDNLDVIIQCTHCWWNPVNAKSLRPFLQKRGIDYILFDKEVQGLQGSTSGAKGAI